MKNHRFIILIAAILAANTAFGQSEKVIDLTIEALYDENDSLTLAKYFEKNYCSNEISFWTANGVSSLQYRTASECDLNIVRELNWLDDLQDTEVCRSAKFGT